MINPKSLVLIPLLVGAINVANPVFAQQPAQTTSVEFKQSSRVVFDKFQSNLRLSGIDARLEVVGNVPTNMQDFALSKLNETSPDAKALMIVIATNRVNKIGTKPSIRLEGKNYALTQTDLDSVLTDVYYPTLQSAGFDLAFEKLLESIEGKIGQPVQNVQSPQITAEPTDLEVVEGGFNALSLFLLVLISGAFGAGTYFLIKAFLDRNSENYSRSTDNRSNSNSSTSNYRSSSSTSYRPSSSSSRSSRSSSDYSSYDSTDYGSSSSSYSSDSGSSYSDSGSSSGGDGGGSCGGGD